MAITRHPFQGVSNILRFNRHFYFWSIGSIFFLLLLTNFANSLFKLFLLIFVLLIFLSTAISICVSYYVYDLSGFYKLSWIDHLPTAEKRTIININAGFDETSMFLKAMFVYDELIVLDFYNPLKHTEVSIKRARQAYPIFPGTISVRTESLPLLDNSADKIFVIFAAHEIRNEQERINFFKELKRVLKPKGQIFLIEHLRDSANFLAFNIGFYHFYSRRNWRKIITSAQLYIVNEKKFTSLISIFTITNNGISS